MEQYDRSVHKQSIAASTQFFKILMKTLLAAPLAKHSIVSSNIYLDNQSSSHFVHGH